MDRSGESAAAAAMAAVVAYLSLLDSSWDDLNDKEKRDGVNLALDAARRASRASRGDVDPDDRQS